MRRREAPFSAWLVLALLVAGGAAVGWGFYEYGKVQDFLKNAIRVPGEVVRVEEVEGSGRPIIRYTSEGGKVLEIEGSGYGPQYVEGQRVVVAYPPGEPDRGQIVSLSDLHRTASIYWALGGATIFVAMLLMVVLWRTRSARPRGFGR